MYGESRENPPTAPFKAVLFDLYDTLAYVEDPLDGDHVSRILLKRGYEVYPQAWDATWRCVALIDYPRYGHRDWRAYLKGVFRRLELKPDEETLSRLVKIYEAVLWKPYPDSESALNRAKQLGLKTAVVTSVARFMFEKSNPKIYLRTLAALGVEPA